MSMSAWNFEDPSRRNRAARHAQSQRWVVNYLAIAVGVAGLISALPAFIGLIQWAGEDESYPMARWTFVACFLGILHVAYSIYLYQLPDWTSTWVASIFMLVVTMVYAFLYASLLLGHQQSSVIRFLQMPTQMRGQAAMWCLSLLCLSGLVSYLCAREAIKWQRSDALRRQTEPEPAPASQADD